MKHLIKYILITLAIFIYVELYAQEIMYTMPEETSLHEGTWLQWPHNHLYGPYYQDDVEPTWIAMTNDLQSGEKVHIIAYDETEKTHIISVLTNAGIALSNIDFFIHNTDDVWIRDNGPMFVYDQNNDIRILDWGFNGWGFDTPYSNCNIIPQKLSDDLTIPDIDLNFMVIEGGAIEHDGNGTMIATRSSVTHSSRNPLFTESQIEDTITKYMGITKFIWLDGIYGLEITDMHIDGFVKFANDSTIITMDSTDLTYWEVTVSDIFTINSAKNTNGDPYNIVFVPLTQNNVVTTYGNNLGYKGSYCNYYIANEVVLVPTYNDPNDIIALNIIQEIYPNRIVTGIDVRNLYEYGGMVHCVTQQQPIDLNPSGLINIENTSFQLSQNSPNPFNNKTIIQYRVKKHSHVKLDIYNSMGQIVKGYVLDANKQMIILNAENFINGIYYYTLIVDDQIVESKKMIINK